MRRHQQEDCRPAQPIMLPNHDRSIARSASLAAVVLNTHNGNQKIRKQLRTPDDDKYKANRNTSPANASDEYRSMSVRPPVCADHAHGASTK